MSGFVRFLLAFSAALGVAAVSRGGLELLGVNDGTAGFLAGWWSCLAWAELIKAETAHA